MGVLAMCYRIECRIPRDQWDEHKQLPFDAGYLTPPGPADTPQFSADPCKCTLATTDPAIGVSLCPGRPGDTELAATRLW